jgi:hypothetical protein
MNSVDDNDIEANMNLIIENGELPSVLYKYTTIDTCLKILESGRIKFSNPKDFNDPFDCQITIDTENTDEELDLDVTKLVEKGKLLEIQKEEYRKKLQNPEFRFDLINKIINKSINVLGVSCFSKNKDNLLMWAHYADKHRGVVLKFELLKDTDFFIAPYPINYHSEYPKFNYIKENSLREGGQLAKFLLETKSKEWEYEEEIRVMKYLHELDGNRCYPIKKQALVEIIFGCQVSDDDKCSIMLKAIDEYYCIHLKFTSAVKKEWEFGLNFIDCEF